MKSTTITDAKNRLSALLDRVRAGESIVITDRGVPIARLEPIATGGDATGRADRLERAGILRPPQTEAPLALLRRRGPRPRSGASALSALLEERRAGR